MKKDYLLKKWLVDKLTDAESKDFEGLDDYELNNKIIDKAKYFDIPHSSSVKTYSEFKADIKRKNTSVVKINSFRFFSRIAAIFIIGIGIYFLFFFNNLTTIKTLAANKISFNLPDASAVTLNADSKVTYNEKKWTDSRKVSLYGEAFFKVAKGSKFDVLTSGGTISVLGTQFNVKNRTNYFEVKCFEGIVVVNSNGKLHQLTKGHTYRNIDGIIVRDSLKNSLPAWINDISRFKGVPLYEVLDEFERQYDVSIVAQEVDTNRIFTGSFVNNNLDQALASITVPFNLTYKKDNSNKITLHKSQ